MPRKKSEAVPEGNYPVPQQEESGSGEPTLGDVYRLFEERFDRQQKRMDSFFYGMDRCFDRRNKKLDEISDETRVMYQHVTSLEHGARQPRLAMEADGSANTKTRERTEGAATAVHAMRGDGFSARWVEPGSNANWTSFGVKAGPPDLPCREDVLVEDGATSLKSCLPFMEMRSPTALVAYFPPAKPLQLRGPLPTSHVFGSTRGDESRGGHQEGKFMCNSIRLLRQQLLEIAFSPPRPEGYRDKIDAK